MEITWIGGLGGLRQSTKNKNSKPPIHVTSIKNKNLFIRRKTRILYQENQVMQLPVNVHNQYNARIGTQPVNGNTIGLFMEDLRRRKYQIIKHVDR